MYDALGWILELLEDGEWHKVDDLVLKTSIRREKLIVILRFLEKFEFLVVDNENNCVRLKEDIRNFLVEIQRNC